MSDLTRALAAIPPDWKGVPCPACGGLSAYVRLWDLYMHEDGSENATCWLWLARGVRSDPRPPCHGDPAEATR